MRRSSTLPSAEPINLDLIDARDPQARLPKLLTVCAVALFIFPADMVVGPIGAVGYVAMLLAITLFALWGTATIFGKHDPLRNGSPARLGLGLFWIASITAYVLAPQEYASPLQRAAADRWVLSLLGISGAVLIMGGWLTSLSKVSRFVRALVAGGTICAVVALYQFVTQVDPMDLVRSFMIGFSDNGGNTPFQPRGSFVRVAGSTFHPIELGVVSTMILPLAVWRALFDQGIRRPWLVWLQVTLVGIASVLTVSRSAILALAVMAVIFIPFLPKLARRWAMLIAPAAVVAIFLVLPGFVTTITEAFGAGTSDPSLATRVNNYPRVEALVSGHPATGIGPGAYMPANALEILDNQYLTTAINMGLIGVMGLLAFFALPAISSAVVALQVKTPVMRCLAGAVAAGSAVAVVASATFDSLSFPVFTIVVAFTSGLAAATWNIAKNVHYEQLVEPAHRAVDTGGR